MLRKRFSLKDLGRKGPGKEPVDAQEASLVALYESIEAARKEWLDAKTMFDQATEKDRIDALIHKIDACEREYMYLLKLARSENLMVHPEVKLL